MPPRRATAATDSDDSDDDSGDEISPLSLPESRTGIAAATLSGAVAGGGLPVPATPVFAGDDDEILKCICCGRSSKEVR